MDQAFEQDGNLLQSKDLLLSALDCIQDGVSILDIDLNVRYVNNSMKYWYSNTGEFIGEEMPPCLS